jgi:DNA polymerase-3 subunit beta
MKFTIVRENLLTPLQHVIGVIERRQTLPILSHVLFKLADNRLEMTGTDLEVQLVTQAVVESGEDGETTVPARKLLDICRMLPDQSVVSVDCRPDKFAIQCGRSRFTLSTLPANNYPEFDASALETQLTLNSRLLHKAMAKTVFAMALQDVRYYLNGLMLELGNGMVRAVSSDGHRLALYEEALETGATQPHQVIVPRKGVMELYRLMGDEEQPVVLEISPNNVRLFLGDLRFSAKLIEGRFPDFQRLMPREVSKVLTVHKDDFKAALTRVAILSNEKYKGVSLEVQGDVMHLSAQNPEHEEAEEDVGVRLEGEGFAVGFNAAYLLDAINNIDSEQVRLSFTDAINCCLIEDLDDQRFKFIVMPMRL